jgi:hypothetical protein
MATPPRETSEERLAAAQARAAAAAKAAMAREEQERAEISRAKLAKLLKLDAATRSEALADEANDLVPADRRRLLQSLKGAPRRPPAPSGRKTLVDMLVGHGAGAGSWAGRLMDVWHRSWILGRGRTPVVAKDDAPRRTGKTLQASAGTRPSIAASPTRRSHDWPPEHERQVGAVAPATQRVDVGELPGAIEGGPIRPSDPAPATPPPLFRRGVSLETIRKRRSAAEVDRLKALPPAELAVAVTTGVMADLTDDDRQQVLDLLIAAGHTPRGDAFAPGARPLRKPLPMTGKGLPFGPGAPPQDPRIRVWVGCAWAVIAWGAVLWLGYGHIVSSTSGSP